MSAVLMNPRKPMHKIPKMHQKNSVIVDGDVFWLRRIASSIDSYEMYRMCPHENVLEFKAQFLFCLGARKECIEFAKRNYPLVKDYYKMYFTIKDAQYKHQRWLDIKSIISIG